MSEVNDVSANWKVLFRDIREDDDALWREVDLSDSKADLYDFANEILMQTMRERLIGALQAWAFPNGGYEVMFGNKFFATMNEQQQRTFFRSIVTLPLYRISLGEATDNGAKKPAITIHTSALLDALGGLDSSLYVLRIGNVALRNQSDVEALTNIIVRVQRETFREIHLEGIECPITNKNQDEDGPVGFLDPLLYVSSLHGFKLSARTPPSHSCLVSPKAVRALFGEARELGFLHLHGLGLNDSHCHAIAEELRAGNTSVGDLSFESNPAISAQGYGALLGLINRSNVIDRFFVHDKRWEAELNLVSEMNREHGRLEYLTDGTFPSEELRRHWLERLANLPSWRDGEASNYHDEDGNLKSEEQIEWEVEQVKEWEAKQVNFILYELLHHPEFMQT